MNKEKKKEYNKRIYELIQIIEIVWSGSWGESLSSEYGDGLCISVVVYNKADLP